MENQNKGDIVIYQTQDCLTKINVKSAVATQFRRWASDLIKEYLKKGYALDDNAGQSLSKTSK